MSGATLDRLRDGWPARAERLEEEQGLMDEALSAFPCLIVLEAAIELGIGDLLHEDHPLSTAALAAELGLVEARLEAVLRLLAGIGLVAGDDRGYRLLPRGTVVLPSAAPRDLISPYLDFYRLARPLFPDFVPLLRASSRGVAMAWPPNDEAESRLFERFMTATSPYVAAFLDQQVDWRSKRSILDVGGGDGTVACLLCEKHPDLTATVVNLPHVEPLVVETAHRYGVADRIRFVACDFLAQSLPRDRFDAVLFARMLVDWPNDVVDRLVGQGPDILGPGGELWVCEPLAQPGRTWDADPWFTFWKTLVPGYWQHGPRSVTEWDAIAARHGLSVARRRRNDRQPLPGLVLQTLRVGVEVSAAEASIADPAAQTVSWLVGGPSPPRVSTPRTVSPSIRARLHGNELSETWPEHVQDAIGEAVARQAIHRYPDPRGLAVRTLIGESYAVGPDQVVLGAGSLEVIDLLARSLALAQGPARSILVPEPTFPAYAHIAATYGLETVSIPLTEDFHLDEAALREGLSQAVGLAFFSRPNNPTGTLWSGDGIRRLAAEHPETAFVVDEVYLPYADAPSIWTPEASPNLIVVSSFSKTGLAGLRLGYAIGHRRAVERLRARQLPFTVSCSTLAVGELFLTRFEQEQRQAIQRVITNRDRLGALLACLPGSTVFPSAANMVLARLESPETARSLVATLESSGISIHGFPATSVLADAVRVTVGTSEELSLLERSLRSWEPVSVV